MGKDRDTAWLSPWGGQAWPVTWKGRCCLRLFVGGFQVAGTESQPACVTHPRVGSVKKRAVSCGCTHGTGPRALGVCVFRDRSPVLAHQCAHMCPCPASAGLTEIRCMQERACVCAHTSGGLATWPCASGQRQGSTVVLRAPAYSSA